MSTALRICLLGGVEVLIDGKPVAVAGRRPRALLAVLALSPGQWVSSEALYRRVWGDEYPRDVRASLYTCVRRLRKVLGADAIDNDGGKYRLCVSPDDVDAVRFVRLLDRASCAPEPGAVLGEALALWGGAPFGDEVLSPWLNDSQAHRLTERWLCAALHRIDLAAAEGRHGELVDELESLTEAYPLREPIWERYLVALDAVGRHADALAAYERLWVRLADELGIDPSPDLQGLFAELLGGGVSRTERTPPASAVPRELPADTAAFVGRAEAIERLDAQLSARQGTGDRHSAHPMPLTILVVHGLGGVGKTTLVVHWAHRVADRFPDGQLFVDLRGFGPGEPLAPEAALDVLLRGLGVPARRIPSDLQARSALLRSVAADKRLLVVLDNARDAEQVRPLLPGAGCLVLVTSRGQLRGLVTRENARLLELDAMSESEAVCLLRSRVASRQADDGALARIATLCGHLPLTLAMAVERANRDRCVELADLVEELSDERGRLDALGDPDDPLSDVRAVFSWSYRALDADAARMFRCLGMCPTPDFSLEAAAALAGATPPVARRLLDRLVSASMLARTDDGRFRLHDLVRMCAVELAHQADTDQESKTAFDRLCRWALRSATNAKRAIRPSTFVLHPEVESVGPAEMSFDDEDAALRWQRTETAFLTALAHAAAPTHPWTVIGLARLLIGYSLSPSVATTGALQLLALDAAREIGSAPAEAIMLSSIGCDQFLAGDRAAGAATLRAGLDALERIDDDYWRAHVLGNLAVAFRVTGDSQRAIDCHRRSLELGAAAHESAMMRNNHALALLDASLISSAVAEARHAVDLARRAGGSIDQVVTLDTLGQALTASGDHARAIACFTEALVLLPAVGTPGERAMVLTNLARCQYAAQRPGEAAASARSAIALIDEHRLVDGLDLRRSDLVELLARIPIAVG